jgi:hypothetical protein
MPLSLSEGSPGADQGLPKHPHDVTEEESIREEFVVCEDLEGVSTSLLQRIFEWLVGDAVAKRSWRSGARNLLAVAMMAFGGYLFLCLLALIGGTGTVYPELGTRSFDLSIFLMNWYSIATLSAGSLQAWYILVVCAIVVSAILVALKSWRRFLVEMAEDGETRNHSPYFEMCGLLFAMLFITELFVFVLEESGTSPANPFLGWEHWEILFVLTNAVVWEEIVCRGLFIGLPLIVIYVVRHRPLNRICRNIILGGGIAIGWAEIALILISAAVFGAAHYEGWGSWKVLPTAFGGMALGYIFLKHGMAASIMLHFSWNYMDGLFLVAHDSFLLLLRNIGVLIGVCLGLVFTIYYVVRILEFATRKKFFDHMDTFEVK